MSAVYEIHVCPLCGAQCNYDGGYEGEGWQFECEHRAYGSEYGTIEPLTLLVDAGRQVRVAVEAAAPAMEKQREEHQAELAERKERERLRWEALTPEQQERERKEAEVLRNILRDAYAPMLTQYMKAQEGLTFWRGAHWKGKTATIPKFVG